MRILQVVDLFTPLLGGAQIQTQLLSEQLVAHGHDVAVATIWQKGLKKKESFNGVEIHRIQGWLTRIPWLYQIPSRRDAAPVPDPGLIYGIRKVVNKFKPDIVMVNGWIIYSCAFALIGTNVPMIVSSRDYSYACATRSLMQNGTIPCSGPAFNKCMDCATQRFGNVKGKLVSSGVFAGQPIIRASAAGFVNVSHFVRDMVERDLIKRLDRPNKVIFDLSGDVDHDEPDKEILQTLPDKPFILYVGSIANYKGIYILLDAYKKLKSPPDLVLVGIMYPDSPQEFPDGVTLIQQVPHATVLAIWERCLFGIVPSIWPDPLPNVTLEGMSKSKPMIGTNAGGIPDMIIDNETGFLFPMGDSDALADAMQKLIDNPQLINKYGEASRRRIDEFFASEVIVQEFVNYYEELIGS